VESRRDQDWLEDEATLVASLKAGDPDAFDCFARAYLPGLLRYALARLGSDPELARDLAQTTVCKALKALGRFRGEAPLALWLRACCANEIAGHFRRSRSGPHFVPLDDGPARELSARNDDADPERRLLDAEERQIVHLALDQLPEHYAAAVEWRYLEGLDVPNIAARLQMTYKATESLLSRARASFRRQFEKLSRAEPLGEQP
jgi:RNA polymerase sigma-70 factor (ECF subfamily)